MARLAVIGATGGIGQWVVKHALAGGHHDVSALVRDPSKVTEASDRLTLFRGDVTDSSTLGPWLEGADMVISCLGTRRFTPPIVAEGTRNVVAAMEQAGLRRIAMISSVGIGDSKQQGVRTSRVFMYAIVPVLLRKQFWELKDAEDAVRRDTIDGIVVRPTGLSNADGTGRWTAMGPDGAPRGGMIPRADVAAFLLTLVDDRSWDGRSVSLYPG